mmetsp:Transcript_25616/g.77522  ORF Transcript_25616/g.77522 Transcript_25616/m.77522 type:complete len:260 (-) Transcript_25616:135-914(-)
MRCRPLLTPTGSPPAVRRPALSTATAPAARAPRGRRRGSGGRSSRTTRRSRRCAWSGATRWTLACWRRRAICSRPASAATRRSSTCSSRRRFGRAPTRTTAPTRPTRALRVHSRAPPTWRSSTSPSASSPTRASWSGPPPSTSCRRASPLGAARCPPRAASGAPRCCSRRSSRASRGAASRVGSAGRTRPSRARRALAGWWYRPPARRAAGGRARVRGRERSSAASPRARASTRSSRCRVTTSWSSGSCPPPSFFLLTA